jgi:hypothetical protein
VSVFATIIVANKDQAAAQDLTSPDMFTSLFKKGLRKYWVSSGNFPQDYFDALADSALIFAIETDQGIKPTAALAALGMIKVIEE